MVEKIVKSEAEWQGQLSEMEFKVLRKHATERAFTHDNFPKSAGIYKCKGCGAELFDAETKFDSGTGWPSFFAPMDLEAGPDAGPVGEREDNGWFMRRTEVHCNACEGHLGHVFNDGPQPTGLRYCINGVALEFAPKET